MPSHFICTFIIIFLFFTLSTNSQHSHWEELPQRNNYTSLRLRNACIHFLELSLKTCIRTGLKLTLKYYILPVYIWCVICSLLSMSLYTAEHVLICSVIKNSYFPGIVCMFILSEICPVSTRDTSQADSYYPKVPRPICSLASYENYDGLHTLLLVTSNDIEPNPGPTSRVLKLMHLNINGLRDKVDTLSAHIIDYDVVAITETHLDNGHTNDAFSIEGFNDPIRKDYRSNSGGICVYLAPNIVYKRLTDLEITNMIGIECMWLELRINQKKLIFGTFYRNPALPVLSWDHISNNIDAVVSRYGVDNVLIMGDLNQDLLNPNLNHLKDIINSFAFCQLVTEPTRVTPTSKTLLDPLICGVVTANLITNVTVSAPFCSDHSPVSADLLFEANPSKLIKRQIWLYDKANWVAYNNKLGETNWRELLSPTKNVDTMVNDITSTILNCAKETIPRKTIKINKHDKPWMTYAIKQQMKKRDKLFKKASLSNTQEDFMTFKKKRNEVTNLIRKTKQTFKDKAIQDITDSPTEKDWWRLVKKFIHPKATSRDIPPLLSDTGVASYDKEKATVLNDFFSSITKTNDADFVAPPIENLNNHILNTFDIEEQEVADAFKLLNVKKANGPDEIHPLLLTKGSDILIPIFTTLFQYCLNTSTYPALWKQANVSPVFKKGDPHNPRNYRPISLISIVGKLMERILHKHIYNHVHHLISEHQSGFLPGRSTCTQWLKTYHEIQKSLDDGNEIVFIFLDMAKAFDKVSHKALLHKLKCFGIGGKLLDLLTSYLQNRMQRVVINGSASKWKSVCAGVPQGSILGPLFFLIFINDISIGIKVLIELFADDTFLYLISKNILRDSRILQEDLNKITLWANFWRMSFNEDKSECLLTSRKHDPSNVVFQMNGNNLSMVETHNHLGLTLNRNGTWNDHVNLLIDRVNKRLGLLRVMRHSLDRKSLDKIYKSYIRPLLEYCDVVWDCIPEYLSDRLERVQFEALRIISGLTISCSKSKLLQETGYETLKIRRYKHRLTMLFKIRNNYYLNTLSQLLPDIPENMHQYGLRNSENYHPYRCHTNSFRNSFFPSTVLDWNLLPEQCKNSPTLQSFKNYLDRLHPKPSFPSWYTIGHRYSNIQLARLRNNCSNLNEHLYQNHIIESPYCTFHPNTIEDTYHYFFQCNKFIDQRTKMLNDIHRDLQINLPQNSNIPEINTKLLLFGHSNLTPDLNSFICIHVHTFITSSKRFSQ